MNEESWSPLRARAVGLFSELERHAPRELPSLRDARERLDPAFVDRVLAHLRDGEPILDEMTFECDPLEPETTMSQGVTVFTDGRWLWRSNLEYLVDRYWVELPEDFVRYACSAAPLTGSERAQIRTHLHEYVFAWEARFAP